MRYPSLPSLLDRTTPGMGKGPLSLILAATEIARAIQRPAPLPQTTWPTTLTEPENEYQIAAEQFGYNREELLGFTKNALNAAFVDGDTRKVLLEKCGFDAVG